MFPAIEAKFEISALSCGPEQGSNLRPTASEARSRRGRMALQVAAYAIHLRRLSLGGAGCRLMSVVVGSPFGSPNLVSAANIRSTVADTSPVVRRVEASSGRLRSDSLAPWWPRVPSRPAGSFCAPFGRALPRAGPPAWRPGLAAGGLAVAGGSVHGEPVAVVDFMLPTARLACSCWTWRTLSAPM